LDNHPSGEREDDLGSGYARPDYTPAPLFMKKADSKNAKRTSGQKILLFLLTVAMLIIGFVMTAVNSERMIRERQAGEKGRQALMSDPSTLQNDLLAAAEALRYRPEGAEKPETPAQVPQNRIVVVRPAENRGTIEPRLLTDEEREAARRYRDMKTNALLSKSRVEDFQGLSEKGGEKQQPAVSQSQLLSALGATGAGQNGNTAALVRETQNDQDVNAWQHKLGFLTQDGAERTPRGYSTNTRRAPLAEMELKAGSVIPGLLLTGLNSDLPGTVIGQVSENVWDTASGRFLLIPQGTRILGVYDSRITQGQKRVAIVWNRLIYPDGSSLNIEGSPGTDLGGYSGIKGRVDNHYGQLLAAALFTSVFATLADVAAGDSSNSNSNDDDKSASDVLAETAGVTIANIGSRLAERALDIQPTIVIKPGSRFNVMVQQDVVFAQPWRSGADRARENPAFN
jgi:type IV secretion system protein VirB10